MKGRPLSTRAVYGLGTISGAVARGTEAACALTQLWLFTRILPESEFGRLAFVLALVQVLAVFAHTGFESLVVFKLSRSEVAPGLLTGGGFAGAALGWAMLLSTAAAACLSLGGGALAALLGDPALAFWLQALAWLIPACAAAETYGAWHLARQRVVSAMLVARALPTLLTTAALTATWLWGWGPAGVAASLIGGRTLVFAGWWLVHPVSVLGFWKGLDRADARYACNTAVSGLIGRAMRQCDLLLLLPLAGPVVSGQYAVAQRLAWILRAGLELLVPIFWSRAGQLLHARDAQLLQREHDLNRAWSTIAALCLALPMVSFGPGLLRIFGGSEAAYGPLLILVADQVLFIGLGMSGVLLAMANRSGWSLGFSLAMLASNAVLTALLVPALGATGAALATFISFLGGKILTAVALWRLERIATVDVNAMGLLVTVPGALLLAASGVLSPDVAAGVCAVVLAAMLLQQAGTIRVALRAGFAIAAPWARR